MSVQKTENGWREVLVDIDPAKPDGFRYVISRMATPASAVFVKVCTALLCPLT